MAIACSIPAKVVKNNQRLGSTPLAFRIERFGYAR